MTYSKIAGVGGHLPAQVLTNRDLEKIVDTSDEWIMKRVGIRKRHIVGDTGETASTMAHQAAQKALAMANLAADDLDMIIVATSTPDCFFPNTACLVQQLLGVVEIPAFDINVACAGFIYGISLADQYIRNNVYKNILVIGVDALTRLIDWTDRSTCVLFGDGAGAAILSASEEPGILGTHIHANGHYKDLLYAHSDVWPKQPANRLTMLGNEVFKVAVTKLGAIVDETLTKEGIDKSEIDWLIPHQANMRIIIATAKRLNLPMEKVILTVEEHGNTSAASIPLALEHGILSGKVKHGELLMLEAFGAGFAWGSALVRY